MITQLNLCYSVLADEELVQFAAPDGKEIRKQEGKADSIGIFAEKRSPRNKYLHLSL